MKIKNIIRIILLMSLTLFLCSCRNNNGGLIRIKDNVLSIDLNELNNVKTTIDDFSIIVTDKNNDLNKISEKTQNVIQKLMDNGVIKENIVTEIFDKDPKNIYSKISIREINVNKTKKIIEEMFNFSKDRLDDFKTLSENDKVKEIMKNFPFVKTNKEKSKIDLKFGDLEINVTMNSNNK